MRSAAHGSCRGRVAAVLVEGDHQKGWRGAHAHTLAASE